ncbi:MAG: TonB-dependent receptor [Bacteroidetes bacterium]|nr:TonB-dependent receptor [Bacteroidota bacterium]
MGNPGLTNERQNAKEIGFEIGLLEDRIQADFTVYNSLQKDQILAVPTPSSSGYTFRYINAGEVKNSGFEARLQISPIKQKNGLRWDLFGTYTRNKNVVVSLPGGVDQVIIGGFSGMNIVAAVGKPMGTFYAVDLAKDPDGRQIIDTLTGNPLSTTTPTYLGSFQPKFIASWGTTVKYKGFFMNVLFDTKQGGYFYSRTKDILEFVGVAASTTVNNRENYIWDNSVVKNAAGEYVTNTQYKTDPYYYYTSANVKPASQDLVKAGYIKLREIALGYNMPQKWFKGTFIGSGNISVFGNNLAIWTNRGNDYVDPEVNSGGASNEQGFDFSARPSVKNYGFKIGLTF